MTAAITRADLQDLATSILSHVDTSIGRIDAKLDATAARLDARIDANTAALGELTEEVHLTGVKLEQLGDEVQVAFEGITSTQEQVQRSLAAIERRLGERITLLEEVMRDASTARTTSRRSSVA